MKCNVNIWFSKHTHGRAAVRGGRALEIIVSKTEPSPMSLFQVSALRTTPEKLVCGREQSRAAEG